MRRISALVVASAFCVVSIASSVARAEDWSTKERIVGDFYGRHHTVKNQYEKCGCLTKYEVEYRGQAKVHFKVTFTKKESGRQSWDWYLDPGASYEWSLGTCEVTDVEITVLSSDSKSKGNDDYNPYGSGHYNPYGG